MNIKQTKLNPPNQTGFGHHIVLVGFVLLFVIGGIYMLVAGRAQAPSYDNPLNTGIVRDCTLSGTESVTTSINGVQQTRKDVPYYQTLKKGQPSSDCVRSLQNLLNYRCSIAGKSSKLDLSGKFDNRTTSALRSFQKDLGISAENGTVGSRTWGVLQVLDPAKAGQLSCV